MVNIFKRLMCQYKHRHDKKFGPGMVRNIDVTLIDKFGHKQYGHIYECTFCGKREFDIVESFAPSFDDLGLFSINAYIEHKTTKKELLERLEFNHVEYDDLTDWDTHF